MPESPYSALGEQAPTDGGITPRVREYAVSHDADFRDIDFLTGLNIKLYRADEFTEGELTARVYYAGVQMSGGVPVMNTDGTIAGLTPVVREDRTYTRTSRGFAISRQSVFSWYVDDVTMHPLTKTHVKYYDVAAQIVEGVERRKHIVDRVSGIVFMLLMQTRGPGTLLDLTETQVAALGSTFKATHNADLAIYIETSDDAIVTAVQADVTVWLDDDVSALGYPASTTIRDVILDEFTAIYAS